MKENNKNTKMLDMMPSTLENIDYALYEWINEKMNIHSTFKSGWKKVEVIWVSAERVFLAKKSKEAREQTGALILPLITIERKNINKDLAKKGKAFGNVPLENDAKGGSGAIMIAKRINQDKTSNFVNADIKQRYGQINFPKKSKRIVYETMTIPMPVYIEVEYEIKVKSLYQQQMNEILQPFMTKTLGINYFVIKKDGHRYEAFMDSSFANNSNVGNMEQEERMYESVIGIKVLGYLIGAEKNEEQPKIIIRENATRIAIPREHVIFDDKTLEDEGYVGIGGLIGKKSKRSI